VWAVPEYLLDVAHTNVLPPRVIAKLGRVDERLYRAGLFGKS
jgi:hypothetical protein